MFNNVTNDGKVLSPLRTDYPDTPLPQEISDYVLGRIAVMEGPDHFDQIWDVDTLATADSQSYKSIYNAASQKAKLHRLSTDFSNMLNIDGLGADTKSQWHNATLLKTAIDMRALLADHLIAALDTLKSEGALSNAQSQTLVNLSVSAGHVNEELITSLNDFIARNPDPAFDSGEKDRHFLFEIPTTKNSDYYLCDVKHGNASDRLMRAAEGSRLADNFRNYSPALGGASKPHMPAKREDNFDALMRRAVLGDNPTPKDPAAP